ncbi:MAG: hypothetical protein NXH85_06275 [Pseudomonadaceae bacterium]|nr:hypothetical protein [Pseudomonadaceae bacterium]
MSQSSNRTPPLLALGSEIARGMVTLHLRGASQFVQTQVEFLSGMQSASAPEETRRVQQQYVEAMCDGAQQHAQGLMAVFANLGARSATESEVKPDSQAAPPAADIPARGESKPSPVEPIPQDASHSRESASTASDDLTQVSGIGRVFATKLAALGITRFADLADLDLASLENEDHPLHDYRARVVSDEWIEQAKKLAQ